MDEKNELLSAHSIGVKKTEVDDSVHHFKEFYLILNRLKEKYKISGSEVFYDDGKLVKVGESP